MTIKEDLTRHVQTLAKTRWGDIPRARVIPSPDDLTYGNTGEHLDVTILYADIAGSTTLVDTVDEQLAAEYYSTFLYCASKLVTRHGGSIQAYDGDRVMAVYVGDSQADDAVSTALELHYAVVEIINPAFLKIYDQFHKKLTFTVGIDSGTCLAIKVGTRSVGEIAWIGAAANYAAKLNSFNGLDHEYPIRVTAETFNKLSTKSLYSNETIMWQGSYTNVGQRNHYRSKYKRELP
jgi:class 3 adenylate cyclase